MTTPQSSSSDVIKNISKNSNKILNKTKNVLSNLKKDVSNSILDFKSQNNFSFLKLTLLFILLTILFLLIYVYYSYLTSECIVKKDFLTYFMSFEYNRPCQVQEETIILPNSSTIQNNIPTASNDSSNNIMNNVKTFLEKNEVFHIDDQIYTFEEAKCKCESYGTTLATEEQMIESYNNGAHWCSYGWNEGQNAFYPIQKCIWEKEEIPCSKKYGLIGGYFPNSQLKFGVNCYGKKPIGTVLKKKEICDKNGKKDFCQLPEIQGKVKKDLGDDIVPFNPNQWSQNGRI